MREMEEVNVMRMMRRLNHQGMHTAEYAICFGLVVAAVVGMQTYVKRAIQARVKASTDIINTVTSGPSRTIIKVDSIPLGMASLEQFEPYYQDSKQTSDRASLFTEKHDKGEALDAQFGAHPRAFAARAPAGHILLWSVMHSQRTGPVLGHHPLGRGLPVLAAEVVVQGVKPLMRK